MSAADKANLKALLFDAYGTLFDLDSLVPHCNAVFRGYGPEICRLWRAKQLEYTHLLSMMGRYEDFWQVTHKALVFACQALKLECAPEERDRLLEGYFHLDIFPDVRQALEALSGRYPLGIVSNGTAKMIKTAVENAGLQAFFSQFITSCEVRSYRPNLQVYQWACQKLRQEPDHLGLASAHTWDVNGARAFGLWAAWVNRQGAPWEDLGFEPNVTLASLTELAAILGLSH
jgi:2-haloacid dehalogenase